MARNRYSDDETYTGKVGSSVLKRLLKFSVPYSGKLVICLITIIIGVGLSLSGPLVLQRMIDNYFPDKDVNGAIFAVAMLAGIEILGGMLSFYRSVVLGKVGQTIVYDLRKELFAHLQTLSFEFFDSLPTGKILVRLTSYIDALASLLTSGVLTLVADFATLIGIVVIMLIKSPMLAGLSFCAVVPLAAYIIFYRKKMGKLRIDVNNKTSNRNAYLHENIMGVKVTQGFNREDENQQQFDSLISDVQTTYMRSVRWGNTLWPIIDVSSTAGTALLYYAGYGLFTQGALTPGEIAVFASYLSRFWAPINSLSSLYSQIVTTLGYIEKIFETLDTKPGINDAEDAQPLPLIDGRVDFDHVSFAYEAGAELVLDDVSFTVKPGQTVALVGPTGAGKTTIVSLLSRFYDPTDGSVLIDGHNIKRVTLESLRSQVTTMMQDSFVFAGNIIENIRYGKPAASDEECIAAAKSVHADIFIDKLPDGYYTRVEERGGGLSAGEKQLLSFARIILADPKIIILDEATSAIDTETEQLVQRALASLLKNRTSFVIAHRLSTIRNADLIMCVANHCIAESGNHEELMNKKGLYYDLTVSMNEEQKAL